MLIALTNAAFTQNQADGRQQMEETLPDGVRKTNKRFGRNGRTTE